MIACLRETQYRPCSGDNLTRCSAQHGPADQRIFVTELRQPAIYRPIFAFETRSLCFGVKLLLIDEPAEMFAVLVNRLATALDAAVFQREQTGRLEHGMGHAKQIRFADFGKRWGRTSS